MTQPKFFKDDNELLQYGYYQVNDFRTFSKFEAWQFARDNNISDKEIHYFYNDDKFAKFDWTVDPTQFSINSLYRARALELRDKYDYISVMYSGGIDSHMILQTFIENDIKIDEIVICSNSFSDFFNREPLNTAAPFVKSLDLEKMGIKFTIVDIGPGIQNQFTDLRHLHDTFHTVNGLICPWSYYIRSGKAKIENLPHHIELSQNNKKVLHLWGLDKPNLFIEDGYYTFRYMDGVPDFGVKTFINKTIYKEHLLNVYDEGFFISMDSPEIIIKQCHLLANELNKMNSNDPRLISSIKLKAGDTSIFFQLSDDVTKILLLGKKTAQQIYYPTAPHDRFNDDKVYGSTFYTKRDDWFFRQKTEVRNNTIAYYKKILRENENYFKYTFDGVPDVPINILGTTGYRIKKKV
jgi:hypothetical protein